MMSATAVLAKLTVQNYRLHSLHRPARPSEILRRGLCLFSHVAPQVIELYRLCGKVRAENKLTKGCYVPGEFSPTSRGCVADALDLCLRTIKRVNRRFN